MRIVAIAAAVPTTKLANSEFGLPGEELKKYEDNMGIFVRRVVANSKLTTVDLCAAAAQPALDLAGWAKEDVDGLIFVSQTPDYVVPFSAGILQHKLGLGKGVFAFDVNLGCSGYTYGLILIKGLIEAGVVHRCILAVGDTSSRCLQADQIGHKFLFGDAGAVTLLERGDGPSQVKATCWGTDGVGAPYLMVAECGSRDRANRKPDERSDPPRLVMDGAQVFVFALQQAVPAVKQLMTQAGWTPEDLTALVFHQANKFILENIARRCKVPMERVPLSLDEFGNTSSASIPLTMVVRMADQLRSAKCRLLLVGFGVGWSWSGLAVELDHVPVAPLIEL